MYHFSYFKEGDERVLAQFISDHPFAFLSGSFSSGIPVATQVPILTEIRDGQLYLLGHIMKNTDHHKAFVENPQALAVFTGPHAYVSASWYSNPHIGSTWNYMSVHAGGQMRFMTTDELIDLMKRLTLHFERGNTSSPTIYDNLPAGFLDKMMPGIVGFEIKVTRFANVFKLSQNRDEKSYRNIMEKLEEQGGSSARVAAEMRSRLEALFPPGVAWDASRFTS